MVHTCRRQITIFCLLALSCISWRRHLNNATAVETQTNNAVHNRAETKASTNNDPPGTNKEEPNTCMTQEILDTVFHDYVSGELKSQATKTVFSVREVSLPSVQLVEEKTICKSLQYGMACGHIDEHITRQFLNDYGYEVETHKALHSLIMYSAKLALESSLLSNNRSAHITYIDMGANIGDTSTDMLAAMPHAISEQCNVATKAGLALSSGKLQYHLIAVEALTLNHPILLHNLLEVYKAAPARWCAGNAWLVPNALLSPKRYHEMQAEHSVGPCFHNVDSRNMGAGDVISDVYQNKEQCVRACATKLSHVFEELREKNSRIPNSIVIAKMDMERSEFGALLGAPSWWKPPCFVLLELSASGNTWGSIEWLVHVARFDAAWIVPGGSFGGADPLGESPTYEGNDLTDHLAKVHKEGWPVILMSYSKQEERDECILSRVFDA